jgi:replicative DNA helicase
MKINEEISNSNNVHRCINYKINELDKAFDSIKKKEEYYNQCKKGFIFLTSENAGITLEVQSNNINANTEIHDLKLSISITINNEDDVYKLKKYLCKHIRNNAERIFILYFSRFSDSEIKTTIKYSLIKILNVLNYRYTVFDDSIIHKKPFDSKNTKSFYLTAIENEIKAAKKIDELKKSIKEMSVNENLHYIINKNTTQKKMISTGFKGLDEKLGYGGLCSGKLYVFGAITSLGKTTFALNMANNIAKSDKNVLFFSLEMSRHELIAKSLSKIMATLDKTPGFMLSKTAMEIIDINNQKKTWENKSLEIFDKSKNEYKKYAEHIFISECLENTGVIQIKNVLENFKRLGYTLNIIIIDYLQILYPYNEKSTDKQSIDRNISELKRLSRDFDVSIIIISSLNRDSYLENIDFKSFKESGSIEYSCDVVIGLQFKICGSNLWISKNNDEKQRIINEEKVKIPRNIELIILKNRMYKSFEKINFNYYTKYDYFIEKNS